MDKKKELICEKGKNCTAPFCICYLELEKKEDEKTDTNKV